MDRTQSDDDRELTRAGYLPQFRRGLGSFTAFAAGFSYLSILTGVVQYFYLGYREAGPASFWTWPIVFLGQLLLAFCFADLAHEFPFCGGIYAWSRRTGSHFVGWMTGWVYLASLVVTLAAVALAWQIVMPSLADVFQFVDATAEGASAKNAAILGVALIAISTFLNAIGNRWMALIMNIGVVIELLAAILLIVCLGLQSVRGPQVVMVLEASAESSGGFWFPLLAAAMMSAYVMYGFDTAGTLAEETIDPKKNAPRAILRALVAAAILGGLLLIVAMMSTPNLQVPELKTAEGGLPFLIKQVLGEKLGKLFLVASAIAIFVCTLAVQANTVRVLFAMARDRVIPGWRLLSHVSSDVQSPRTAAILVGVLATILLLINVRFEQAMTALACVSIVWANLAYLLTTGPLLLRRIRKGERGVMVWMNALAVVWGMILIVNIGWPRGRFYGEEWYTKYSAVIDTLVMLAAGFAIHFFFDREGKSSEVGNG